MQRSFLFSSILSVRNMTRLWGTILGRKGKDSTSLPMGSTWSQGCHFQVREKSKGFHFPSYPYVSAVDISRDSVASLRIQIEERVSPLSATALFSSQVRWHTPIFWRRVSWLNFFKEMRKVFDEHGTEMLLLCPPLPLQVIFLLMVFDVVFPFIPTLLSAGSKWSCGGVERAIESGCRRGRPMQWYLARKKARI